MLLITLIILFVPMALLLGIALPRAASKTQFVLNTIALGLGLLFMWLVFPWDIVSVYYRLALPWMFLICVWAGYRRIQPPGKEQQKRWVGIFNIALSLILTGVFLRLSYPVLSGYQPPEGAIALVSPLRDGRFVVGHGGASPFINGHASVNVQRYALDVVGYNVLGMRYDFWNKSGGLDAFEIFGHPLYSPCDGRIVMTVDGLPDLPIGQRDRENLAGNYVLIECQGAEVVLAHLKSGSVEVSAGRAVNTRTLLGQVGNSGNTSEPHLHMHAERGGKRGIILDGTPVPMLVDQRFLVRGDTL